MIVYDITTFLLPDFAHLFSFGVLPLNAPPGSYQLDIPQIKL